LRAARYAGALIKKRCVVRRLKPTFPDSESKEVTELERNREEGRKKERKRKKKDICKLTKEGRQERYIDKLQLNISLFSRVECAFGFRQ
jgi:hypothetical protein